MKKSNKIKFNRNADPHSNSNQRKVTASAVVIAKVNAPRLN